MPVPGDTVPEHRPPPGRHGGRAADGVRAPCRHSWRFVTAALLVLAVHLALVAAAGSKLGVTIDERLYIVSSRVLWEQGTWDHAWLRFHGPLALWPNQLFLFSADVVEMQLDPERWIGRARLGMLGFAALGGLLTWALARRVYGEWGGLIALTGYALHPMMLGYSGLCNVDQAHAAATLLAIVAAWHLGAGPSLARAAGFGASVGLLLTAKYLAVLAVPGLALAFVVAVLRRGAAFAAGAAAVAAASAVIGLHAMYVFRGGFASTDPAAYAAGPLVAAASVPVLGSVLAVLPDAWMRGLDMVGSFQDVEQLTWLAGTLELVQSAYFALSVLMKSPETWLVLLALAMLTWPGALVARDRGNERRLVGVTLATIVPPFLFMSFVAEIQSGIRYVHQCIVPACVLTAGVVRLPGIVRLDRRWLAAGAGLLFAWQGYDSLRTFPNFIAYFNRTSGDQFGSLRVFRDSNNDFGQLRTRGEAILREREGDALALLRPFDGARLGRVAAYVTSLTPRDPERPSRTRHWLDALEPESSLDAAWWIWEVTEPALRAAAERQLEQGDERGFADLALALAGAGRVNAADAALEQLSAERAAELRQLLDVLHEHGSAPAAPLAAERLARLWLAADRPDLALERLASIPPNAARRILEAHCHLHRADPERAARLLDDPEVFAEDPRMIPIAAGAWNKSANVDRAIELLEQRADEIPEPLVPAAQSLLELVRWRRATADRFGVDPGAKFPAGSSRIPPMPPAPEERP